MMQIPSTPEN